MTPEQVRRWRARSYALIGVGIAGLAAAYQFKVTQSPEGAWSPVMPVIFGIAGILSFAGGVGMLLRTSQQTASGEDLSGPQVRTARLLGLTGFVAVVGLGVADHFAPAGEPWTAVKVILIAIAGACFVGAGRIARKLKAEQGTK